MTRAAVPLTGALLLVVAAAARLPPPSDLVRPAATPFDRSEDRGAGPALVFFTRVAPLVPPGSSVAARAASGDPRASDTCSLLASSLLPGRLVVPARIPIETARPDYAVYLGRGDPSPAIGRLVLRTSQGSLWKLAP